MSSEGSDPGSDHDVEVKFKSTLLAVILSF